MITKQNSRSILDWKGHDWSKATDDERLEFALASDVMEAGLDNPELRAIINVLPKRPLRIVETGFGWGYSARIFITHVIKYGGEYHAIDIKFRDEIVNPLTELGLYEYVIPHKEDSRTLKWKDGLIDFLNLDSEHSLSFVLAEYFCFRPYLSGASVIGFHDVDSCWQVREGIEIINRIDGLEMLTYTNNKCSMGWAAYRIKSKDYANREILDIPLIGAEEKELHGV